MLNKQIQDKQANFRFKTTAEANGAKTTILNAVKSSKHSTNLVVVSSGNGITVTAKNNEAGAWLQSFEKNARRALNVRDAGGSRKVNQSYAFKSNKAALRFAKAALSRLQAAKDVQSPNYVISNGTQVSLTWTTTSTTGNGTYNGMNVVTSISGIKNKYINMKDTVEDAVRGDSYTFKSSERAREFRSFVNNVARKNSVKANATVSGNKVSFTYEGSPDDQNISAFQTALERESRNKG